MRRTLTLAAAILALAGTASAARAIPPPANVVGDGGCIVYRELVGYACDPWWVLYLNCWPVYRETVKC